MRQHTPETSQSIVHWIFQRGAQLVTCRVDREADGASFTTSVIPHGHTELAATETFNAGIAALQAHAEIAARLRQLGWTLMEYTTAPAGRPVAA